MRDLRFRAWDKKRMIYDVLPWEWDAVIRIGSWQCVKSRPVAKLKVSVEMAQDSENWKIMQYTGLKDKNGKEIYEGDVVKYDNRRQDILVVQWDSFGWAFFWKMCNEMWLDENCEVIGNICENKNLLKGE